MTPKSTEGESEKIAVEIDGHDYHKTKEQRSRDAKRDRDLLALGWTTLRFTGSDVYRDQEKVAREAIAILTRQANGKQLKTQA